MSGWHEQADPNSGMSARDAHSLRVLLEMIGGVVMASALATSTMVQVHVYRAVQADGGDDEHDDFKVGILCVMLATHCTCSALL